MPDNIALPLVSQDVEIRNATQMPHNTVGNHASKTYNVNHTLLYVNT